MTADPGPPEAMSVSRVASIFGVNPKTVRLWIYSGHCPAQQVGDRGRWRVSAEWVRSEMDRLRPRVGRARRRIVEA